MKVKQSVPEVKVDAESDTTDVCEISASQPRSESAMQFMPRYPPLQREVPKTRGMEAPSTKKEGDYRGHYLFIEDSGANIYNWL